jgi:hypothetical protein
MPVLCANRTSRALHRDTGATGYSGRPDAPDQLVVKPVASSARSVASKPSTWWPVRLGYATPSSEPQPSTSRTAAISVQSLQSWRMTAG